MADSLIHLSAFVELRAGITCNIQNLFVASCGTWNPWERAQDVSMYPARSVRRLPPARQSAVRAILEGLVIYPSQLARVRRTLRVLRSPSSRTIQLHAVDPGLCPRTISSIYSLQLPHRLSPCSIAVPHPGETLLSCIRNLALCMVVIGMLTFRVRDSTTLAAPAPAYSLSPLNLPPPRKCSYSPGAILFDTPLYHRAGFSRFYFHSTPPSLSVR